MSAKLIKRSSRQRSASNRLNNLFNDSPVMLYSIDQDGRIRDVNREWLRQTGYSRAEVLDQPANFLMSEAAARYCREQILPRLLSEGAARNVACEFIRKNGSLMPVMIDCVTTSDDAGRPVGLAVVRDMTELNRLHQQSLEYTKLQSMLEIAGTICHELNQPLQVLVGRLDLIRLQDSGNEKLRTHLDSITQSVKKISDITLKLRHITNYQTKPYLDDYRIVDLNEANPAKQPPKP